MCSPKARVVSAVGVGTVLLFFGILALTFAPAIVDRAVLDQDWLGYNEGTKELNAMTKSWQRPPYDMKLQIYLFNITNTGAVMQGAKPIVQEIGPFTFIEEMEKSFEFNANGSRVIYRNKKTYHFNSTLSCPSCSLRTRIFIPNIIFQKFVDFSSKSFLAKLAVQAVLTAFQRETAFYEVSADEILFKGYEDPILGEVCKKPVISAFCGKTIPERIGIFYGQNGTDDGSYEISTGKGAPYDIGKVYSWNGKTMLDNATWDSPYARMINGTDGQLFPPLIQKGDSFSIFNSQAGRTINMEFEGISSYRDVPSYRFGIPTTMFDGTLANNADFCNKDTPTYFNSTIQPTGCLPKGFIDVGRTQPGAPRVYLSQAHFFDVEPLVAEKILGMRSGSQKNDTTFVDIEPTSGVPIRARRAMQISVGMLKGNLDIMAKMNPAIVPLLWMNETILFDEGTRDQLKNQLLFAKHMFFISGVGLVISGATVWIALAAVLLIFSVSKEPSSEDTTILVEEEQQPEVQEQEYQAP